MKPDRAAAPSASSAPAGGASAVRLTRGAPGRGAARRLAPRRAARAARERAIDHRAQAAAEVRDVEARGVLDARARVDRERVEAHDGVGERRRVGRVVERAGLALEDGLADAAVVQRDDRAAGGLGLDRGDAELLRGGHDERAARPPAARRPRRR